MKKYLASLSIIGALFVSSCGNAQNKDENSNSSSTAGVELINKDVNVAEFEKLIAEGNGIILDVRTDGEFAEGHLKGATQIDIFSSDFESKIKELDPNIPVYVYCRSGKRSGKAANSMKGMGFLEVYNLEGGILAWQGSGKPIEK